MAQFDVSVIFGYNISAKLVFILILLLLEIDCGKPPKIANGDIIVDNTTLNSSVLYFCDDNFRLIGHSKTFCTENGNWYPSPPVCYGMLFSGFYPLQNPSF